MTLYCPQHTLTDTMFTYRSCVQGGLEFTDGRPTLDAPRSFGEICGQNEMFYPPVVFLGVEEESRLLFK